ncbi:MAG: hypothetical protein ACRD0P_34135, partial [Stackebrandtia sp.]
MRTVSARHHPPKRAVSVLILLLAAVLAGTCLVTSAPSAAAAPPPVPQVTPTGPASTTSPTTTVEPTATPEPGVSDSVPPSPDIQSGVGQNGGDEAVGAEDECWWANLGCKAKEGITGWFQDLAADALKPVLGFLADTQLGTPEIGSPEMAQAEQIWSTSQTIANACFVLLVTLAGVLLMAGETFGGQASAREVVPRLVLAFVAVNTSLIILGYGIQFANGLARAILMAGGDRIDTDQAGRVLAEGVESSINTGGAFLTMVVLVVVVMAVVLAFIYIVRLAIIMVLIGLAPVALMFHALPLTDGLARLWWRGITGALAIQVCQS